jgi:hypothetical protein
MKSIFIVLGVTGENEQQRSWLVKAFPSEKEALGFIEKLESTYQSFADEEEFDQRMEDELVESMKALDENFEFDPETGTEYSITECPFEGSAMHMGRPHRDESPSRGSRGAGRRPQRR